MKNAIGEHITQTEGHVSRLEEVFELFGKKTAAKKWEAMEGLVKECDSIVAETEEGSMTRDAAIILASQKVEHYEIETYGGVVQFAKRWEKTMQQEYCSLHLMKKTNRPGANDPGGEWYQLGS